MKVVIIGSGNVATVLGKLIKSKSHDIVQVVSQREEHAAALAEQVGCGYSIKPEEIDISADLYLVAISDSSLYYLNKDYQLNNKLVVHTAGSVSKDVLKEISVNYGVLYPLQSIRKEQDFHIKIPMVTDGNTEETKVLISDFAKTLSDNVIYADDQARLRLHIAAVFVSNFTNHLYALAETYCHMEKVDFRLLLPLLQEVAIRLDNYSPSEMQTGPALRKDIFTLDKHLQELNKHPRLKYIYLKLTESILKIEG